MSIAQRYMQVYTYVITNMKKTLNDTELELLTEPQHKNIYIYNMVYNSVPLLKSQIIDYENQHNDIMQKNNEELMLRFIDNAQQRYVDIPYLF